MNRELLVKLIRKNIDELIMLTEGFMEMTNYPEPIINLAKNKTDDIWTYIHQLGNLDSEKQTEDIDNVNDEAESLEEIIDAEDKADTNEIYHYDDEVSQVIIDINKDEDEAEQIEDEEEVYEEEEAEIIEPKDITNLENVTESDETDTDEDVDIENTEDTENIEEVALEESNVLEEEEENDTVISAEAPSEDTAEKKTTLAERLASVSTSRNESLSKDSNGGLNNTIANKKVDDIRQAISLGDRFRFQRELFKNNGEELNKTLNYINKLASYSEVLEFLQAKYGWNDEDSTVIDFYQLLKRKF
ncbi:MAG: hypothetical protein BGO29_14425 [Bacteroidales bacterium 36-12]|mgnify:CR=1 FL=1|nr:MAG: hypothetical protein BGO29_14425 [Bacteroidales bacterium 36-12]